MKTNFGRLLSLVVLTLVSVMFTGCISRMNYEETGPGGIHIRDKSVHVLQPFAGVAVPGESHSFFGASVGGSAVPVSYGYGGSYIGNSYGYGGGYGYNGYNGTIIVPIESQRHYMRETWNAYGFGHNGRGDGGRQGNGHQGGQGGSYGYGGRGNGGHQGGGHQGGGSYGYGR